MRQSKPLLGYLDKTRLKPSLYRALIPLSLFWVVVAPYEGLRLWHRHDLLGGGILFVVCLCQALLAFMFWRLSLAARSPDWRGDRWFQPVPGPANPDTGGNSGAA